MFSNNLIFHRVKQLLTEAPEYRDRRHATQDFIIDKYYAETLREYMNCQDLEKIKNTMYFLNHHIDRAFRKVQQDCPELRGRKWLWRQLISGEITAATYQEKNGYAEQLNFDF